MSVERIFVEKKSGFDIEAQALLADIRENLLIHSLETLRIINRYDIEGLNAEELEKAVPTIFFRAECGQCHAQPGGRRDRLCCGVSARTV